MEINSLSCPGCYIIRPKITADHRGQFTKTFQKSLLHSHNLNFDFSEEYYSTSKKGVVRGLHFQTPPEAHEKLVTCILGRVLDVFVDMRKSSPTYKKVFSISMTSDCPFYLFLPKGIAHGFFVESDDALMLYKTSTEYKPDLDTGILWNSVDFEWPIVNPIISERDMQFVELKKFQSPF